LADVKKSHPRRWGHCSSRSGDTLDGMKTDDWGTLVNGGKDIFPKKQKSAKDGEQINHNNGRRVGKREACLRTGGG